MVFRPILQDPFIKGRPQSKQPLAKKKDQWFLSAGFHKLDLNNARSLNVIKFFLFYVTLTF